MTAITPTATSSMIRREVGDDHICILTFDRLILGQTFLMRLHSKVSASTSASSITTASLKGVIIASAKKSIFIAGADCRHCCARRRPAKFAPSSRKASAFFNRLAALKIPTVAAITERGAGGGYEITLRLRLSRRLR